MVARLITILAVAVAIVATAADEQVWLSQGVAVHVTDSVHFTLSNTMYLEHGEYFCDEEAFRPAGSCLSAGLSAAARPTRKTAWRG